MKKKRRVWPVSDRLEVAKAIKGHVLGLGLYELTYQRPKS